MRGVLCPVKCLRFVLIIYAISTLKNGFWLARARPSPSVRGFMQHICKDIESAMPCSVRLNTCGTPRNVVSPICRSFRRFNSIRCQVFNINSIHTQYARYSTMRPDHFIFGRRSLFFDSHMPSSDSSPLYFATPLISVPIACNAAPTSAGCASVFDARSR